MALCEDQKVTRRYQNARILSSYLDAEKYAFIHLFDGGLSDNLGVRFILNYTAQRKNIHEQMHALGLQNTNKLAIIVVNARGQMQPDFAKKRKSAPIIDTIGLISSIPLDRYSFDTLDLLRRDIQAWEKSITVARCKNDRAGRNSRSNNCRARTYLIEVSLDQTPDESERQRLMNLPTSFNLEAKDVDHLEAAARTILLASDEFQRLVSDLR
jgi:NTE family protein